MRPPENPFLLWKYKILGAAAGHYEGLAVFTDDEKEAINKLKNLWKKSDRDDPKSGATPEEWREFDEFMNKVWDMKSKTAGRRHKTRKHKRVSRKTRRYRK